MNLVVSEKLFPSSCATLLNESVFSEELFPISFANLLNEFVFSEELVPISQLARMDGQPEARFCGCG